MIGKVSDATDRSSPDQWRRQLNFLLDGLRAEAMPRQTPATPALSMEQTEMIMATILPPGPSARLSRPDY
jgi:hypothetical protein